MGILAGHQVGMCLYLDIQHRWLIMNSIAMASHDWRLSGSHRWPFFDHLHGLSHGFFWGESI